MSEDAEKLENDDRNNMENIQDSKEVVKNEELNLFLPTYRISFKLEII